MRAVEKIPDASPAPKSLSQLAAAVDECRRCPLYRNATQGVPGEGPRKAALLLVGEQPGNDEDLAGKPFVGPAGGVLDHALTEAGIKRKKIFVTNAVKHFKFEQRGKRRMHKHPNTYEVQRCKWWLDQELRLLRPKLIVAMGGTAARSLFGKSIVISKSRGKILDLPEELHAMVTIHPSFLLRIPEAARKLDERKRFISDLRMAARFVED